MLYNGPMYFHTQLTHSYFIDHTDPPECNSCHQLLIVKDILKLYFLNPYY